MATFQNYAAGEFAAPSCPGQSSSSLELLIEVPKDKKVTRQMIDRVLKRGNQFGLKKISRDTDSEAFEYLMRLQKRAAGDA